MRWASVLWRSSARGSGPGRVTAKTHASFEVFDRADVAGTRDTFELDLARSCSVDEDLADWGLRSFAAWQP